jgi:DNA (cytosine-5)-methyltransferase 1
MRTSEQLWLPSLHPPGLTSVELCAGAGGQALGLEQSGFRHLALVEIEEIACKTLRLNRPTWNVIQADIREFSGRPYVGVDLLAGGVPCPPFSIAGKQLGELDERDLFPAALRIVRECLPRAVMLENVRGLLGNAFSAYRKRIDAELEEFGYVPQWKLINARDFGVPQLRPRAVLVALRDHDASHFEWPEPLESAPVTVGDALEALMSSGGWSGAKDWARSAGGIAPTLVGGSRKHGGPDLGPTRAREAWAKLGVQGSSLADDPPSPDFMGMPRLTVRMAAVIQGFPLDWEFAGKKTPAYRQVGNAFPPPVAAAVGKSIRRALAAADAELMQGAAD